jgi:hypothetical protein
MKLIPNWQNQDLTCHFCGTKRSVKYTVRVAIGNGWVPSRIDSVPCCNKCALTRNEPEDK